MHFMINHVCGWKTKACEIKVSIYVHVYSATSEILESKKKKINKIERPIYQVWKKSLPHNFHAFTLQSAGNWVIMARKYMLI